MASPTTLEPVPLPFDPAALRGLSERLLRSHHENNYQGALKNLLKTRELLGSVTRDTPGMQVAGLMERELTFRNSVALHELYFGNLGGTGVVGGDVAARLAASFGSQARWEELFRAAGMALAGGSGWAVLDLDLRTGELRTYWSGHHTQSLASGIPLLVLDMYEHSYALDYGAGAAKYVDAFLQNIEWDEVNRRLARADAAAKALAQ
jgi:Fe-Mn family superoxide dismutase